MEDPIFIYDNSKEKLDILLNDLNLILDLETRANAKFMKNFTLALIKSARK